MNTIQAGARSAASQKTFAMEPAEIRRMKMNEQEVAAALRAVEEALFELTQHIPQPYTGGEAIDHMKVHKVQRVHAATARLREAAEKAGYERGRLAAADYARTLEHGSRSSR